MAILAIGALACLAAYHFWREWRPGEKRFPVQGIDVSHHQGEIDWTVLKEQGVDFAYIKATEGGDHIDRRFAVNWRAAPAAGIRWGAYHFFTLCRPGTDQARNILGALPTDVNTLPVAVDLEYLGNCRGRNRMGIDSLHRELTAFIRAVEARTGKRVLLYLTREFDDAFQVSKRVDRPLWLRSLFRQPDFGARPWTMWQAHNYRRVRGIDGPVDWNVAAAEFLIST